MHQWDSSLIRYCACFLHVLWFHFHLHFYFFSISADIAFYCRAHPGTVLPHPTNCARYFRCPTSKFDSITYQEECTYPALYSTVSQSCQNFSSVSCGGRQEPQTPCKYFLLYPCHVRNSLLPLHRHYCTLPHVTVWYHELIFCSELVDEGSIHQVCSKSYDSHSIMIPTYPCTMYIVNIWPNEFKYF